MEVVVEVGTGGWPVSASALGIGIWVFFAWCWLRAPAVARLELVASFGFVVVAGIAAGLLGGLATDETGLSSLGGVVGAGAALVALIRPWRPQRRWMADHLIPAGVAGLAVARLGCLFQGCDFGRRTDGALAVVHEAGSRAWEFHQTYFEMSAGADTSLAVHPFAAYLALWGLVSALIGEWIRRYNRGPGVAGVACATVFLAGGGAIESMREPATVIQIADGISAYPLLYWMGALAAGLAWWWLERAPKKRADYE